MNDEQWLSEWTAHAAPRFESRPFDPGTLRQELEKQQQKARRSFWVVGVLFGITIGGLGYLSFPSWGEDIRFDIGMGLLVLNMLVALVFLLRQSLGWQPHHVDQDTKLFLERHLNKLYARKRLTYVVIPVYLLVLVLGINLIYLDVLTGVPETSRLWIHVGVSLAICLTYPLSLRKQQRFFRESLDPLIERLSRIRENMENSGA